MTANQKQDTRSVVPTQSEGPDQAARADRRGNLDGRYRSAADDEAYRRSVLEQAMTDIAAGW
jgi:hypothetical protein